MCMNSFSFRAELQQNETLNRSSEPASCELLSFQTPESLIPLYFFQNMPEKAGPRLDFSSITEEWKNPRGHHQTSRFDLRLDVLIANHHKAFRTVSQNLSQAGLYIKDLLPLEFSRYHFDVVLIHSSPQNQKNFLTFRGRASDGPLRSRRIQLETSSPSSQAHLRKLIEGLLMKVG